MLAFTVSRRKSKVQWAQVLERVQKAIRFRREVRGQLEPNARAPYGPWKNPTVEFLMPEGPTSERRKIATLRVARTLADLDQSVSIEARHIEEAGPWTYLNFERLKHWD